MEKIKHPCIEKLIKNLVNKYSFTKEYTNIFGKPIKEKFVKTYWGECRETNYINDLTILFKGFQKFNSIEDIENFVWTITSFVDIDDDYCVDYYTLHEIITKYKNEFNKLNKEQNNENIY